MTSLPELTQTLLKNRGITTDEEIEKFLNPDYNRDTHDPFLILGMERAVKLVLSAIEKNEKIIVYADYDSDGIPGGVILHDFFQKIGYENVGVYIPHRHKEGYGLNHEAIDSFAENSTTLIITVDCGISDVEEVGHAQSLGIDVIVTDHHLTQETLPPAYVILNSKQEDDTYPDSMLCGAGVAYKLVQALLIRAREEKLSWVENIPVGWEKWLLDMAGIATVADMVPLVNENRVLARYGLQVLRKSPRLGLRKLLAKIKVKQAHITEDDIGFMISPRINAASRMDVPIEAFRLLATREEETADELADHLQHINDKRKGLVASMIKEARKKLADRTLEEIIVVGSPKWQPGVLGLVATRLVEDFELPAFVCGEGENGALKGSCRSDGSINVLEVMTAVTEEIFIDVGGHEFSGGFSVYREKIHLLEEGLIAAHKKAEKNGKEEDIFVDAELALSDINWNTYKQVEQLAPFGVGNPKPTFLFKNIKVAGVKHFGKEQNHLELIFQKENGEKVPAIAFFATVDSFKKVKLEEGVAVNLIATLEKSMFRGRGELRLRIIDVRSPE